mmetsp:Transcript_21345/g.59119  ORF Transcript_21345/g.59119 Transcript_21345/m.59119 type:complete len:207 (-) Transcript_21345:490-1110(-)
MSCRSPWPLVHTRRLGVERPSFLPHYCCYCCFLVALSCPIPIRPCKRRHGENNAAIAVSMCCYWHLHRVVVCVAVPVVDSDPWQYPLVISPLPSCCADASSRAWLGFVAVRLHNPPIAAIVLELPKHPDRQCRHRLEWHSSFHRRPRPKHFVSKRWTQLPGPGREILACAFRVSLFSFWPVSLPALLVSRRPFEFPAGGGEQTRVF